MEAARALDDDDKLEVPKGGDNLPIKGLRKWVEVKPVIVDRHEVHDTNFQKLNDLVLTEVITARNDKIYITVHMYAEISIYHSSLISSVKRIYWV